jgi:beta-aspartyl-peptidase (threonine type)
VSTTLVIHGGAGTIGARRCRRRARRSTVSRSMPALAAGGAVLAQAAMRSTRWSRAVRALEDCPLFNAGRGATFTAAGTIEMDAALMDGATLQAGAVAAVRRIRNPIAAARAVMERTPHVLLIGPAADDFAEAEGLALAPPEYFRTEHRWQQLQAALATRRVALDHDLPARMGTVGAVARDRDGRLAAATSTGGMTNKRAGRVGDSPLIGAGTWADAAVAVSCTGVGEAFIRCAAAHELSALMRHRGLPVRQAAAEVAEVLVPANGGSGGLIAVDAAGKPAIAFGTAGMYRGVLRAGAAPEIGIYA